MKLIDSKSHLIVVAILGVYATAFAPLLGEDQRNYLVIVVSVLAACLCVKAMVTRSANDLIAISGLMLYQLAVELLSGSGGFSTIAYTGLFSLTYLAFAHTLTTRRVGRNQIALLLKVVIYSYCAVSVLQAATSLIGLPVLNQMLSKGLWSHNSLAAEPSQAGRALSVTVLAYLMITQPQKSRAGLWELMHNNKRLLSAFMVSALLTGSSLALLAVPLTILLSLRARWIIAISGLAIAIWPLLFALENPASQRILSFLVALPSMDIATLAEADQSGAMRVMPLLIYLDKVEVWSANFLFGEGISAIATYVSGELIGAGDLVAAGFIPGYLISFGLVGTLLLLTTFLIRFSNLVTLPFVLLWILLFAFSAWNSQLFWYGVMLLRVVHHFVTHDPKRSQTSLYRKGIL